MFHWGFDWTPGGHVVDRCLDDLMFEAMLILDGGACSSKSASHLSLFLSLSPFFFFHFLFLSLGGHADLTSFIF